MVWVFCSYWSSWGKIPEVSDGDLPITSLIQGLPSADRDRHRQVKVSISITRMDMPL